MKILLNLSQQDKNNQGVLRSLFAEIGATALVTFKIYTIGELIALARSKKCHAIVTSNQKTINNITPGDKNKSIDDWRGSVLTTSIPTLIIAPLNRIHTSPQGRWILHSDIIKLKTIVTQKPFTYSYSICHTQDDIKLAFTDLNSYPLHVVDIETTLTNKISSVAITPITNDYKIGKSYTIPLLPRNIHDDPLATLTTAWYELRELLASNSIKAFHNGCFDTFQLLRYHCPANNWYFDTEYMWHCWEAEAKKSLAFISSMLLPDYYYWKHESDTNPLEYNAKDTINTARVLIELIKRMPKWAWQNYAKTFLNAIPIVKTQFEGFKVDIKKKAELREEAVSNRDSLQQELESLIGIKDFNAGSPKQVNALFYKILPGKIPPRAKSKSATGDIELKKVARQHPIFARLVPLILKIREERKAISTYYDARLTPAPYNKLLYSLRLDGTETERMACSASSLWAPFPDITKINKSNAKNLGTQAQNLPYYYKKAIVAEDGYDFLEIDKSQSEARCTAYLSGDKELIKALEDPPEVAGVKDFYCYTGFKFFGIEFNKKDPLRQAVKKIIHGTNYIMGADTFIDSVGVENLQHYRKIVGYKGSLKAFATHLLSLYHMAYPGVSHWWDRVIDEIARTGKIKTPDGWVRIFHGNAKAIKRVAVAHSSQHLSVRGVNKAFWKVFYEIELPTMGDYRLKAQIHDSLAGIVRQDEEIKQRVIKEIVNIMSEPQSTPSGDLVIPLDVECHKYWKE